MRNRPQWDRAVWWAAQLGFAYYATAQGGVIHRPDADTCRGKFWRITRNWTFLERTEALLEGWPDCPAEQQRQAINIPEAQPCP